VYSLRHSVASRATQHPASAYINQHGDVKLRPSSLTSFFEGKAGEELRHLAIRPNIRASAASVKAGAMGAGAAQQRLAASVTDKLGGCMR